MRSMLAVLLLTGAAQAAERHFNFTVLYRLSMMYGENCPPGDFGQHCEPTYRAYEREGALYYHNSSANTGDPGIEFPVPTVNGVYSNTDVLVIDGSYRAVPTVNGMVPGPAIEVDEGDTVVVHLHNMLHNAATTIHWHGMYQRGTPWMDGVSAVTQCAVLPGERFDYRFVAEPAGTHVWHAHHGIQRPDGLFGALIVNKKKEATPPPAAQVCDGPAELMVLSVWQHQGTEDVFLKRDGSGWFPRGPDAAPYQWTRDVSGKLVGEVPFRSGLINGKGRFGNTSALPLTTYTVSNSSAATCFRVLASQEGKALRVSVDQHALTVLASDGMDIQPVAGLESVIVFPGETFDIAVTPIGAARTSASLFWVRAETLEATGGDLDAVGVHDARAVLQYRSPSSASSPRPADPMSTRTDCALFPGGRCKVLNCPFPAWPPAQHTDCIAISDTRRVAHTHVEEGGAMEEHFLNFVFEPAINNRRFVSPAAPPLTQPASNGLVPCNDTLCDVSAFPHQPCECTHTLEVAFNATVQLVLMNMGMGGFGMHPMHLHGHHFEILRIGYPPFYNDTGAVCRWPKGTPHPTCLQNEDIECMNNTGCARARWRDGKRPVLNTVNPPLKDTVVVPPGGYVVVRFVADNPGWWHLHCHMAQHLQSGMGMLLVEAPELLPKFPPPPGFPRCGNFQDTEEGARHAAAARARWEELREV